MNEFWTKEKLGKHPTVAKEAERLYKEYAMCSADKLLARLKESNFKFGNIGPIDWNNILMFANLDDCLKQEYVEAALKVTTARPSIGKGEFLLASLFDNIGFAKQKGDLIDLRTKKMAELKGISATISHERQLTDEFLRAIFMHFKMTPPAQLDKRACDAIQKFCNNDRELYYILEAFRNTNNVHVPVIQDAIRNYRNRTDKNLYMTIVGMHLYEYLRSEHASYLLALNNKKFRCFNAPMNVYQAVEILKHFSIDAWQVGQTDFKITLNNE